MNYDFEYYSGEMLRMPDKPMKPRLDRNSNSIEARVYADALEEYECAMKTYNEDLGWYRAEKANLLVKFRDKVRSDYGLSEAAFNVIWNEAYDRSHAGGLQEVYYEFDRLFEFLIKWGKVS